MKLTEPLILAVRFLAFDCELLPVHGQRSPLFCGRGRGPKNKRLAVPILVRLTLPLSSS